MNKPIVMQLECARGINPTIDVCVITDLFVNILHSVAFL
jgi:hypothetical protein